MQPLQMPPMQPMQPMQPIKPQEQPKGNRWASNKRVETTTTQQQQQTRKTTSSVSNHNDQSHVMITEMDPNQQQLGCVLEEGHEEEV